MKIFILLKILVLLQQSNGFYDPHCDGKQVIVHLFEWKWTDIALECERFLAPAGYCGVQTSPPNEHVMLPGDKYPWWQRYQPVSYNLDSRSGSRAEFQDMVSRCNAVGVRVFADAVINHMAGMDRDGRGSGGNNFNTQDGNHDFPSVPYSDKDFTPRDMCPSGSGSVDNYSDENNVRNCYLVGLSDLYGASKYVQQAVADYLNDMIDMGVAGFRVDAAKHMWPEDIAGMQAKLHPVSTKHGFPRDAKPFFYHEVIDRDDGAVRVDEYYDIGLVTEFRYCQKMGWAVHGDWGAFGGIYDPGWGMAKPDRAFVFVDNHDNQRGHGGGGDVVTHQEPSLYTAAVSWMLAFDYGFTRVTSSYEFGQNTDMGPPHYEDEWYTTANVPINDDNSCGGGWVCEHRWNGIQKMVEFRNAVAGSARDNFWSEGDAVGLARTGKGYFAMSKRSGFSKSVQTGMPGGTYVNIIDGGSVTVGGDGTASITIDNPEGIFAICVGCTGDSPSVVTATPAPPPNPTNSGETTTRGTTLKTTTTTRTTSRPDDTTTKHDGTTNKPDITTTALTPGSTVTSGPASCCQAVSFASSGGVLENYPDLISTYTTQSIDEDGRPVYGDGTNFLHFMKDSLHHFEGWTICSSPGQIGSLINTDKGKCGELLTNAWEYANDNEWKVDDTVSVDCKQVCCEGVIISSTGEAASSYPELMGQYFKVGEENGKAQYNGSSARLHYVEDVIHHWSGWVVGEGIGSFSHSGDEECPSMLSQEWEVFGDDGWIKDESVRLECACCSSVILSSVGGVFDNYPELLDTYTLDSLDEESRPVYTNGEHYLYFLQDLAHHFSGWTVSSGQGEMGTIVNQDGAKCVNKAEGEWEYLVGESGWEVDGTMFIGCDSTTTPKPTSPKATTPKPTTPEPTTPKPTTMEPTTPYPTTPEPTTPKPTTPEPTRPYPTTQEPTTPKPTTKEPTTPYPTTQEPTTQEPTTPYPTTKEPTTPEPTTPEPTTPKPTTPEPTTPYPTTPEPTTPKITTPEPTTPYPTTSEPTTLKPTTQEPTTQEPTTPEPTTP